MHIQNAMPLFEKLVRQPYRICLWIRKSKQKPFQIKWISKKHCFIGFNQQLQRFEILSKPNGKTLGSVMFHGRGAYWVQSNQEPLHIANKGLIHQGMEVLVFDMYRIWTAYLIALLGVFFLWPSNTTQPTPTTLAAMYALPAKGLYGNLVQDQTHYHRLTFTFSLPQVVPQTLIMTTGNISDDEPVMMVLNGHSLGSVKASPNYWDREQRVALSEKFLQAGANKVELVYRGDPYHAWGVKNIYLVQATQGDSDYSSEQVYQIAQKLYVERAIKKGNLLRAKKMLERAKNQSLEKKHFDLLDQIIRTLTLQKEQLLRQARVLVRTQNFEKAKKYYQTLLDEMIDPVDPEREAIVSEMVNFGL